MSSMIIGVTLLNRLVKLNKWPETTTSLGVKPVNVLIPGLPSAFIPLNRLVPLVKQVGTPLAVAFAIVLRPFKVTNALKRLKLKIVIPLGLPGILMDLCVLLTAIAALALVPEAIAAELVVLVVFLRVL